MSGRRGSSTSIIVLSLFVLLSAPIALLHGPLLSHYGIEIWSSVSNSAEGSVKSASHLAESTLFSLSAFGFVLVALRLAEIGELLRVVALSEVVFVTVRMLRATICTIDFVRSLLVLGIFARSVSSGLLMMKPRGTALSSSLFGKVMAGILLLLHLIPLVLDNLQVSAPPFRNFYGESSHRYLQAMFGTCHAVGSFALLLALFGQIRLSAAGAIAFFVQAWWLFLILQSPKVFGAVFDDRFGLGVLVGFKVFFISLATIVYFIGMVSDANRVSASKQKQT